MFRSVFRRFRRPPPAARGRPWGAGRYRPRVEALEARTLLAATILQTGQTFPTISQAIAAASSTIVDTIQVDNNGGVPYAEQLFINKSLVLQAAPNQHPIVTQPAGGLANSSSVDTTHAIMDINGHVSVTVSGFVIRGPNTTSSLLDAGIYVHGGAFALIQHNTIASIRNDPPLAGDQTGFGILVGNQTFDTTGSASIIGNQVFDYQKAGIRIDNNSSANNPNGGITGNLITGFGPDPIIGQNGIEILNGSVANIVGNSTQDNNYTGPGSGTTLTRTAFQAAGILLFNAGAGNTVIGNTVDGNDLGIYSFAAGNTTISKNNLGSILPNDAAGIVVEQGTDTVSLNTINGGAIGIAVASFTDSTANTTAVLTGNLVTGATIGVHEFNSTTGVTRTEILTIGAGNTITGNTAVGVQQDSGTLLLITLSTITNNPIGILLNGGQLGRIYNNDLSGNTTFAIDNLTSTVTGASGNGFGVTSSSQLNNNGLVDAGGFLLPASALEVAPAQEKFNELFLVNSYQDILGRSPDDGGYYFFLHLLDFNFETPRQVAFSLANSPEGAAREINDMYVAFLGRQASPGDVSFWLGFLAQPGHTLATVQQAILGSPEFAHTGLTPATAYGVLVNNFYEQFLERGSDPLGSSSFVASLLAGDTVSDIIGIMVGSTEYFHTPRPGMVNGIAYSISPRVG